MHFRHQRLIFTATGHSHIDKQSFIILEMECQWQEMVFSLTTVRCRVDAVFHISSCQDDKSAAYSVQSSFLISIRPLAWPLGKRLAEPGPSLCIWTDRISCYTWVNKHHAGELSSLSWGWDKSYASSHFGFHLQCMTSSSVLQAGGQTCGKKWGKPTNYLNMEA